MKTFRFLSAAVAMTVVVASSMWSSWGVAHEGHDHGTKIDEKKIAAVLSKLSVDDRTLVEKQRYCPMMDTVRLGSMGAPVKVVLEGKPIFVCCKECESEAKEDSKKALASAEKLKKATAALAKLNAADLALAESQLLCPINEGSRLGSMGVPVKIEVAGKPVFLCCKGCKEEALSNPKATLAKIEQIKKAATKKGHGAADHDHKSSAEGKQK